MSDKALALREPAGLSLRTIEEMQRFGAMAFASGMLSAERDKTKAIAIAAMAVQYGAELGLGPMASLQGIQVIQGRPCLSAGLIASRIQASGRYTYRVEEHSDTACRIAVYHVGGDKLGVSTFTKDDAKKANLGGNNWSKYPRNMLFARAISNAARWYCPDVFNGAVYTPDELAGDLPEEYAASIEVEVATVEPDAPAEHARVEYPWGEESVSRKQWDRIGEYADNERLSADLRGYCAKAREMGPARLSAKKAGGLIGACKAELAEVAS